MFAVLGFLIACLFGTVVASLLWRRAVSVTKRSISQDENFASLEEVADLKSEIGSLQNTQRENAREIRAKEIEIAALEEAKAKAEGNTEHANKAMRDELANAGAALEKAVSEREEAKSALKHEQETARTLLAASQSDLAKATERVAFLETSIRTLAQVVPDLVPEPEVTDSAASDEVVQETEAEPVSTVPNTHSEETPVREGTPDSSEEAAETTETLQSAGDSRTTTPAVESNAPSTTQDDAIVDPSVVDVTKSLEERIEALKQGQVTH
jgi:chromosome segregation ATPase